LGAHSAHADELNPVLARIDRLPHAEQCAWNRSAVEAQLGAGRQRAIGLEHHLGQARLELSVLLRGLLLRSLVHRLGVGGQRHAADLEELLGGFDPATDLS
jgi:hypothetical protein